MYCLRSPSIPFDTRFNSLIRSLLQVARQGLLRRAHHILDATAAGEPTFGTVAC